MSYNYFPKVLEGNKDRNSNVKHVLYGVLTRYLRFLPQTHQGEVCMRTEVFGVKKTPSKFKNYCVMWSLHLLIYEQRFKPCSFVIWIGSFNNTNQSLSAWGKKPSHCDELLMLINSARMHQFLLYTLWWIVLLSGPSCSVLSWGLQKKFQHTTNFPWWYCTSAWSSSCPIFTSFTVKAGQKS